MAKVSVRINGFNYIVGCEDGQEGHLQAMAHQVESRIGSIKALGGQSGEARLLVLAALLMADELHDMAIEMNSLRAARPMPAGGGSLPTHLIERLNRLAERAEDIAAGVERS